MSVRSNSAHNLLLSFVACLLLCGVLTSEIPELVSLTDDTSNDFSIRKFGGRESATMLSSAIHESVPLDARKSECEARALCLRSSIPPEMNPADLLELHCVFRR